MFQLYRPSGKISAAFYPMFILIMLIVAPSLSFLYIYLVWYIPSTVVDVIVYVVMLLLLASLSAKYCIKIGKVRNPKAAGWIGCIIFLWFCYLSIVVFHTLKTGQNTFAGISSAFLDPKSLQKTLQSLKEDGYAIESIKNGVIFNYRGTVMAVVWILKFLASIIYIGFHLWDDSNMPFCEATNKWAKKYVLQLDVIPDVEEFKKQILFGNHMVIRELKSIREANKDYCEADLFIAEGAANYYVTFVNKRRKGEPDKSGEVKFEDEDIFRFLAIDHDCGNVILTQGRNREVSASVKIVNSKVRSKEKYKFIEMFLMTALQFAIIVFLVMDHDRLVVAFSNMGVMLYLALNVVVFGINLFGSLLKEDVVEDESGLCENRGARSYMITKKSSPSYVKWFYFIMFVISLCIFAYCVKEIML